LHPGRKPSRPSASTTERPRSNRVGSCAAAGAGGAAGAGEGSGVAVSNGSRGEDGAGMGDGAAGGKRAPDEPPMAVDRCHDVAGYCRAERLGSGAFRQPTVNDRLLRLDISPPEGGRFVAVGNTSGGSALSPDGRMVALVTAIHGNTGAMGAGSRRDHSAPSAGN
jgi:hypothetical protein